MPTPAQTKDYLIEVLGLDPELELGQISELRERFHRPPKPRGRGARTAAAASGFAPGGELGSEHHSLGAREQAVQRISAIREVFWRSDENSTRIALNAVETGGFPDLGRAVQRLHQVNELRDEVDALEASPKVRGEHLNDLRMVLSGATKDAAAARDHLARRLGAKSRSSQLKPLIKAIRQDAPEIAELESEWLVRLRGAKKERKDSRVVGGLGCFGAYSIFVLIRFLIRVIRDWMENS